MHKTGETFCHWSYVTVWQFAFAYAINHFMTVPAPVEVMPESSDFNLW